MKSPGRGVSFIYYPLIVLSGLGISICLYIWFRQYTLFFGMHMISRTTVAFSMLFGMATGSRIIGRLADKFSVSLVLFIIIQLLTGLFALLHPFLFSGMIRLLHFLTAGIHPGPFGMELTRLLLTVTFLFIPMVLIGGTLPSLAKHLIKSMAHAGSRLSNILTAGAAGMLAGLLSSVIFLIPAYGTGNILVIAAFILLFNGLLAILFFYAGLVKTPPGYNLIRHLHRTSMKFRKKKIVLETGAKLSRTLLRVHAFQGFFLSALLLMSYRLIADFGWADQEYLFAMLAAVMLTGIMAGTILYKWIAEKTANPYLFFASFMVFAAIAAAASLVLFGMHAGIFNQKPAEMYSGLSQVVQQSLPAWELLFLPAVLIGITMPLPGRVYPKRVQKAGNGFGRLGSVFLLGIFFGLVITSYLIIPFAGLYRGYFLLILLAILSGLYLLLRDSRLKRGFRLGFSILAITVYLSLVLLLPERHLFRIRQEMIRNGLISGIREGSTGTVKIYRQAGASSLISLNGKEHYSTDEPGLKTQLMPAFLPVILNNNIRTALVSGFGTGITAWSLASCEIPSIHITDFNPEMIKLAAYAFSDLNDDVLTASGVDITLEDVRTYLFRTGSKLDLITTGASLVGSFPHLYTSDFYKICLDKISDKGYLSQVIPTGQVSLPEFKALIKSCTVVFPSVSLWYITPEQFMLLAGKNSPDLDFCRMSDRFKQMSRRTAFERTGIRSVETLIAHMLMDDAELRSYAEEAPENSDNRPYVEFSRVPVPTYDPQILQSFRESPVDFEKLVRFKADCPYNMQEILREIFNENISIRRQLIKAVTH